MEPNKEQIKFVAEILNNIGVVFLATIVLPSLAQGENLGLILSGLTDAGFAWFLGYYILREVEVYE